jgi:hypothetical protein
VDADLGAPKLSSKMDLRDAALSKKDLLEVIENAVLVRLFWKNLIEGQLNGQASALRGSILRRPCLLLLGRVVMATSRPMDMARLVIVVVMPATGTMNVLWLGRRELDRAVLRESQHPLLRCFPSRRLEECAEIRVGHLVSVPVATRLRRPHVVVGFLFLVMLFFVFVVVLFR